jgi:hypothetical protein
VKVKAISVGLGVPTITPSRSSVEVQGVTINGVLEPLNAIATSSGDQHNCTLRADATALGHFLGSFPTWILNTF